MPLALTTPTVSLLPLPNPRTFLFVSHSKNSRSLVQSFHRLVHPHLPHRALTEGRSSISCPYPAWLIDAQSKMLHVPSPPCTLCSALLSSSLLSPRCPGDTSHSVSVFFGLNDLSLPRPPYPFSPEHPAHSVQDICPLLPHLPPLRLSFLPVSFRLHWRAPGGEVMP